MTTYQSENKIKPWQPIARPGEVSETRLIRAILDGTFPINSTLPGERDLAQLLGVTRPTLREAMQRMERDGWLEIRHGKPTRVRDFWTEGNFGVSIALARNRTLCLLITLPNCLRCACCCARPTLARRLNRTRMRSSSI